MVFKPGCCIAQLEEGAILDTLREYVPLLSIAIILDAPSVVDGCYFVAVPRLFTGGKRNSDSNQLALHVTH